MKSGILMALVVAMGWPVHASAGPQTQELVVLPKDLPEAAQTSGQSMALHSSNDVATYLSIEQGMGKRLAVLDVTDPARIKQVAIVTLDTPATFDFVCDLDGASSLICFRNNRGAAVMDSGGQLSQAPSRRML